MPEQLRETSTVHTAEADLRSGTAEILIISPGTGSSGVYSREVLQQAAADRVFPAGLHTFLDHPARSEESDRPERSVRDLAGTLTSDAEWRDSPEPGLYATARIYPQWRPVIAEMHSDIGVSIRASGERDRDGNITRLIAAQSVDYVTRAGRGGRVLELLESARTGLSEARNAGQWLESRLHLRFTEMADGLAADGHLTRDERIGLSAAIGDALTAFNARVAADLPHLYERDPYDQPDSPTVPTQEHAMPEISQEELDRLRAVESTHATVVAERDALRTETERLTEARDELRARDLQRAARDHAAQTLTADGAPALSEAARRRVIDRVCAGDLPVTESGALDTAVLTERATTAAIEEAAYLAEAIGGPVTASGGRTGDPTTKAGSPPAPVLSETERAAKFANAFGLSESAAKAAATI